MCKSESPSDQVILLSKEEAIAEVRRWLEVEQVDPEKVFTATGDSAIRYRDLIPHLEQETPDGKLLLFAISRGRSMRASRTASARTLLDILPQPPQPETPPGS
ncbi:MAG: hypothetical protein HY712_07090 [candidate division NC10 bacterium]|nr:hypothetical protein [candidate division NC10 bacterium]